MQILIICTLNYCPHLALLPLLSNLILFFTVFPASQTGAVLLLRFHILFPLNVLALMLLCLLCHWKWPDISLQWPVITSPSHDLCDTTCSWLTAHSCFQCPFFLLPTWRGCSVTQQEPSSYYILQRLCLSPRLQRQTALLLLLCPDLSCKPQTTVLRKNINQARPTCGPGRPHMRPNTNS